MNAYDLPPDQIRYSHEAEASLIGAVLIHGPDAYDAANSLVTADSFYDPLHRLLWSNCEKLVLAGKHVDVVALIESMRGIDVDWRYVNELTNQHLPRRTWTRNAEIVSGYAQQRALEEAADVIRDLVRDETAPAAQRVSQSVALLEKVVEAKSTAEPLPVSDFALSFIDRVQNRADGVTQAGRPTNIPRLDRLMPNGLGDGKLVVIAARPSVGKSSFAQQIALTHAQAGVPAAFLGMEMENDEVTDRTVANIGRVRLSAIQTGRLSPEEWDQSVEAVERLRSLPLYLYDVPGLTLADVASKARSLVRKYGIKTLVVDYLQLMQGDPKKDRRFQLEEITRGLKRLAKQLGITVILLSQLNRDVEKRTDPRPLMSDLKECGAIEEDADVILFLWDHRKGEDGAPSIKGCALGKNRGGAKGEVALHFEGQYQRWSESTESLKAPTKQAQAPQRRGMD